MTGLVVGPYDLLVARWLMRPVYRAVAARVAADLPVGGTVLDVGTGPGRLLAELARQRVDAELIGIDPSEDMLDRARRTLAGLPRTRVILAPSEHVPLGDACCDAVVSTLSSHHWADRAAALAEQARLLRPGGRWWLYDLRRELDDDLPAAVTRAGLRLVDSGPRLGGLAGRRLALVAAVR